MLLVASFIPLSKEHWAVVAVYILTELSKAGCTLCALSNTACVIAWVITNVGYSIIIVWLLCSYLLVSSMTTTITTIIEQGTQHASVITHLIYGQQTGQQTSHSPHPSTIAKSLLPCLLLPPITSAIAPDGILAALFRTLPNPKTAALC